MLSALSGNPLKKLTEYASLAILCAVVHCPASSHKSYWLWLRYRDYTTCSERWTVWTFFLACYHVCLQCQALSLSFFIPTFFLQNPHFWGIARKITVSANVQNLSDGITKQWLSIGGCPVLAICVLEKILFKKTHMIYRNQGCLLLCYIRSSFPASPAQVEIYFTFLSWWRFRVAQPCFSSIPAGLHFSVQQTYYIKDLDWQWKSPSLSV